MSVYDHLMVATCIACFGYVAFRSGYFIFLIISALFGRAISTRLDRATNIVVEEMTKRAGKRGGSVFVSSDDYTVEIIVKPEADQ